MGREPDQVGPCPAGALDQHLSRRPHDVFGLHADTLQHLSRRPHDVFGLHADTLPSEFGRPSSFATCSRYWVVSNSSVRNVCSIMLGSSGTPAMAGPTEAVICATGGIARTSVSVEPNRSATDWTYGRICSASAEPSRATMIRVYILGRPTAANVSVCYGVGGDG
jgi:hypothetical protein